MTLTFFVKQPKFNNQGLDALFENLSLILQNRDLILSTPEYRNIYISGMGVYPLYTSPLKLFLGDLLVLWEKTDWKQGDEYIYYVTGSPLSGRGGYPDQSFPQETRDEKTVSRICPCAYDHE